MAKRAVEADRTMLPLETGKDSSANAFPDIERGTEENPPMPGAVSLGDSTEGKSDQEDKKGKGAETEKEEEPVKESTKEQGGAQKSQVYLQWFDLVRFFAVVMVVCGHLADVIDRSDEALDSPSFIESSERRRIGRARSFGAQFALPLLFYASGLSQSFVVPKVSTCTFLARRSWRLLVPLVAAWLLFVWPQIWIARYFTQEGMPVRGDQWNFITGLARFPQVVVKGGLMHLWFLLVLFGLGLLNQPFFRFVCQTRRGAFEKERPRATVGRLVGGLVLPAIFTVGVVLMYKFRNGRSEAELLGIMALLIVPYLVACGVVAVQCWWRKENLPLWFPLLILALNFGISVVLGGAGFLGSLTELHMYMQFNFFYMQGFMDGEFALEYKRFFQSLVGQLILFAVGASWGPVACMSFADDSLEVKRYYLTFPGGHSFEQAMYDMVIAWFWVYLLCAAAQWAYGFEGKFLTPRLMDLINKTGFLLYLTHWLVLQAAVILFVWPTQSVWPLSALCLVALPLALLCALGLVFVCERTPGLGHLFGLYGTHMRFTSGKKVGAEKEATEGKEEEEGKRGPRPALRPQFTLQLSGDWGSGVQTPRGATKIHHPIPLAPREKAALLRRATM
uniref:Acyltransferase 3 domain-containing protein n=1 Tax=Chromera velia CCMP2878 TaxID=1169474 RepID=A0A0G4HBK8_9ALVE|eukprot:Cvel_6155.t1-p1 / transcript=Cvel_6155.t1 / gene=Cvel_6155 / organism=Chromera_velia_CCMP2878 / gene_product=hypothetical protein / transcript_product=hypothetical protein / location=Cvel_scaffold297:90411-92378(+) / protein_length=618 / sequence_SO=supercontig / SO=protein_coding / is_pseudo=false